MKIGHPAEKPAPAPATGSAGSAAVSGPPSPATAIPATADDSAKIALSSTAETLLSSETSAEFDAEKVARLSKAIEDGTFKINPEAIADKLIANAHEALAKIQA